MQEFKHFLKGNQIKEKYIPHYIRWILMCCYAFLQKDLSQRIDNPQKNRFLRHLSSQFEEWQVRQADYTLKLYQYFLSQNQKEERIKKSSIATWQWIEGEATRLLRLKHRSLRMGE